MAHEDKWKCNVCEWRGTFDDLLTANNPFDPTEPIRGCPECKSVEQFTLACDEPECWDDVTCGGPGPDVRYRHTCHKHMPEGGKQWPKPWIQLARDA